MFFLFDFLQSHRHYTEQTKPTNDLTEDTKMVRNTDDLPEDVRRELRKLAEKSERTMVDVIRTGLKLARLSLLGYEPATSPKPIEVGRTDAPLAVLRSHPDFPNTLSEELEGAWTDLNPAWPWMSLDKILEDLTPSCHANRDDFDQERTEEKDKLTATVVYVRPGKAPPDDKVSS